jgi:hypothetical protein
MQSGGPETLLSPARWLNRWIIHRSSCALLLLTAFSGALLALTLLALPGVGLLMLTALPTLFHWRIATLLLTNIGRFVVGVASLLLVCHSKFSCDAAAFQILVQRR